MSHYKTLKVGDIVRLNRNAKELKTTEFSRLLDHKFKIIEFSVHYNDIEYKYNTICTIEDIETGLKHSFAVAKNLLIMC